MTTAPLARGDVSPACLSRAGIRRGLVTSIPFQVATLPFGVAFSLLATSNGFEGWQAMLMSVVVYSGTAQILAIDLMSRDVSLVAIWGATALVSIRYVLLGTSMRDWFTGLPARISFRTMLITGDQSWALANTEMTDGQRDVGYFLGLNIGFLMGWTGGTALGVVAGGAIPEPGAWGLEYAATAAFIAILAGTWRGRPDLLPWMTAAAVALAVDHWIGGQWYLMVGALAGSLVGTLASRGAGPNAR